mgnify:CR=1 FL=1
MNNTIEKQEKEAVSRYAFFLLTILVWTQTILVQYARAVLLRLPLIKNYADECIWILFVLTILLALPQMRLHLPDILFLAVSLAVFLAEWLFYQAGSEYFSLYAVDFLLKALPLYIVGVSLSSLSEKDKETLYRLLYYLSLLTLFFDIIYHLFVGAPMTDAESLYKGNMVLAYNLLPHCCYIAWFAVKKTSLLGVVFCIVGVFYLLMLGTRGAALLYLLFIATVIIIGKGFKKGAVRAILIGGVFGGFLTSSLYEASLRWLESQASRLGLSIRIFERLMGGEITESAGRDWIREQLMEAIQKRLLTGSGLYSDRILLGGGYSHNIVLELWIDFGIILGTLLLVAMILVLFRGYIKAANKNEKGMILSLIFASLLKLFLSGSYLNESVLYLALGLSVGVVYAAKQKSNQDSPKEVPNIILQKSDKQQEVIS